MIIDSLGKVGGSDGLVKGDNDGILGDCSNVSSSFNIIFMEGHSALDVTRNAPVDKVSMTL